MSLKKLKYWERKAHLEQHKKWQQTQRRVDAEKINLDLYLSKIFNEDIELIRV